MGSNFSRNLRDLFEAAGCDGVVPLEASQTDETDAFNSVKNSSQQSNPRPVTPIPHHRTRMLSTDPRSPSFGIVRTPIEVVATPDSSKPKKGNKIKVDTSLAEKHYLETDLDSFDGLKMDPSTPVLSVENKLPAGLSASHLLKLKFLGLDPRSPSEGIARTPIQVPVLSDKKSNEDSEQENRSLCGSLSRSLFGSSEESLNISKACSEPSAFLSDYERSKDWSLSLSQNELEVECTSPDNVKTEEAGNETKSEISVEDTNQSSVNDSNESNQGGFPSKETPQLEEKISQTPILNKLASGVVIFCEGSTRTPNNTPKKKSTRTPLTPICNLTPNDVIRGKKTPGKRLDKEKLVCKVLSGCENTPSKTTSLVKKGKRSVVDENPKLGDWDHDTSIII